MKWNADDADYADYRGFNLKTTDHGRPGPVLTPDFQFRQQKKTN
ncbi:MAG TPA: hypothetical protein VJ991_07885 [Balneolales bacterium]|nr:hypothetical protein [Balneolales bacterium]